MWREINKALWLRVWPNPSPCSWPPPLSSSPSTMTTTPPAAPPVIDAPKSERPTGPGRLPSLNQLAARIGANASAPSPSSTPSNRPRLAASLLRTGSTTSLSTTTSAADSTTVNPPITRSTSPTALSTSPPTSTTGSVNGDVSQGEPLTVDKVEKLAQETSEATKKAVKGYKGIPSLGAITAHYARNRTLSVDGTAMPPEAEAVEDPKTPGVMTKPEEHPLQHTW